MSSNLSDLIVARDEMVEMAVLDGENVSEQHIRKTGMCQLKLTRTRDYKLG